MTRDMLSDNAEMLKHLKGSLISFRKFLTEQIDSMDDVCGLMYYDKVAKEIISDLSGFHMNLVIDYLQSQGLEVRDIISKKDNITLHELFGLIIPDWFPE